MTTENQENTTQVQDQTTNVAGTEANPIESQAREMGWVPKEEFYGDTSQWLDADEFVRRKPLFDKIDRQNKELKDVKKALAELAAHHERVKESEYKRALAELKAQKVAAFEEGNAPRVVQIEEQIDELKEQQFKFQQEQAQKIKEEAQQIHPEFEAWVNKNTWYTKDAPMKAYADVLGKQLAAKGLEPVEVLKEVEKQVKLKFASEFTNENRKKTNTVEAGSTKANNKSDSGYSPTDFERQVAKRFVRQGVFKSEDEYYKQLKQLNGKS